MKYGHVAKMCRATTSRYKAHFVEQGGRVTSDQDSRGEELPLLNIHMVKPCAASTGYMVDLLIGKKVLAVELDTGASVSIISEETWKTMFHSMSLEPSMVQLKT